MTQPFPYQAEDLEAIDARFNGRALVAWEQGLGKTFCALSYLVRHKEINLAVAVCPANVKWVWEHEARKHFGMRVEVLNGTRPKKRQLLSQPRLVIINYDILKFWVERLRKMQPQLVVLDECQYISNPQAQMTQAVTYLCLDADEEDEDVHLIRVPKLLCMSGTPITNRTIEFWSALHLLNPRRWPNYFSFGHRYCGPRKERWGYTFKGATNTRRLHRILTKRHLIRRLYSEVFPQLPPLRRSVVPMDIENRKEYDKAENDFIAWLAERHGKGRASRAVRAKRLVKFAYLKRLAAELKAKAVGEWLDDFLAGCDRKIILFGVHRKYLEDLHKRYKGQSVLVHGGVVGKRRRLAVEHFLASERVRLFIGQVKATGVGWSAKGVRDVAFVEYPWAPGLVQQAMKRAHGVGRGVEGKRTMAYFLVAKDTIESKLLEIIQRKQKTLNRVLEGRGRGEELDVFDQLQAVILRKER